MKSNDILPKHLAIIMDGNGRWAKKRLLPRSFGHRQGVKKIEKVLDMVFSRGIKYLTLYAFSTENWNRPANEVQELMKLLNEFLVSKTPELIKKGICLKIFGETKRLTDQTKLLIADAMEKSKDGKNGSLGICFDYGGRREIVNAVNKIIADKANDVKESDFSKYLYTSSFPDPDIIVRTGGDKRLSNFLLYQCAYAEISFIDSLWPDFSSDDLDRVLMQYAKAERRYGKITE